MKYVGLGLFCLISLACMRSPITLPYSHPNATAAQYLINHTSERFIEDPTKSRQWIQKGALLKSFCFQSTESSTLVHILFFESQAKAIAFEQANQLEKSDTLRSVLNGAVLYIIQAADQQAANELVGWFAGKE